MAPWPEQGSEPKAPDKNSVNLGNSGELKLEKCDSNSKTLDDSHSDSGIIKTPDQVVSNKKDCVSKLDEHSLKALLDEAMSYKLPKDVEGKSMLFKELLQSVETEKKYNGPEAMVSLRGRPGKTNTKRARRRQQNRREGVALEKSSDQTILQDLVQAFNIPETGNNCKSRGKNRLKTDSNSVNKESSQSNYISEETSLEDCNMAKFTISDNVMGLNPNQFVKHEADECRCECAVDMPLEIPLPPSPPLIVRNQPPSSTVNNLEQSQVQLPASYNSVKSLVGGGGNEPKNIGCSGGESQMIYPISMLSIPQQHSSIVTKSDGRDGSRTSSNDEEELETCNNGAANSMRSEPATIANHFIPEFSFNQWNPGIRVLDYRDANNSSSSRHARDCTLDNKKTDENGNSLASNRIENGSDRKNKTRRVKISRNEKNTIMSQNIQGHRSDIASSDIEAVVKYIESPTGIETAGISTIARSSNGSLNFSKHGKLSSKVRPIRDKSSETVGRKGRRVKENKLHKSNSLEEISKSKLEDLTKDDSDFIDKLPVKQTTLDDLELDTDRTWELSNPYMHLANESISDKTVSQIKRDVKCDSDNPADSEFHIVTKKQRKKKGRTGSSRGAICNMKGTNSSGYYRPERNFHEHDGGRGDSLYSRYAMGQCDQRRKSASSVPPSDKSGDSSDLDSIHSLPVSSTTKKQLPIKKSTSSGSTPQASYADIARSVASPPRSNSNIALNRPNPDYCVESCDDQVRSFSPIPTVVFPLPNKVNKNDMYKENMDKDYPPLDLTSDKKVKPTDMFVEFTVTVPKPGPTKPCENISVEETVRLSQLSSGQGNVSTTESLTFVLEDNDHIPNKRPPVILMNEDSIDTSIVTELVFGFEVNQQLLVGNQNEKKDSFESVNSNSISLEDNEDLEEDARREDEDDFIDEEENDEIELEEQEMLDEDDNYIYDDSIHNTDSSLEEEKECYLQFCSDFNHASIVDFVSGEWDLVMNELADDDGRGKIRYFNSH